MRQARGRCHHSRVTGRAVSFGAVASTYEKYRPGYPEELVDEILVYAGRPVRTALEIGAGTGKATRVFARRGIAVTATDPDAGMLNELRKHVPSTVDTVHGAFEELALTSTYDLVFAAASLHWTQQAGRWLRVATLLNPDGVFASFGGQMCLADLAVEEAVHSARAEFLADDAVPSPDGTPEGHQMQWPGTELAASSQFKDVQQSTIERRTTMSARDYVNHLSTISAYLELPASARAIVFDRILQSLPERVTLRADLTLHVARMR